MKLWAYVKLTLIQMIKDFHTYFLVFAIFPIALGLLMGYFQKDVFTPSVKMSPISIFITDEDNSEASKALMNFLASKELNDVLEVKSEKKDIKSEVIIPKGYGEALNNSVNFNIKINSKKQENKASQTVSKIIDNYNNQVVEAITIKKNIQNKNISEEDKQKLFTDVSSKIYSNYTAEGFSGRIVNLDKSLSSYEYYSITLFSFMLIMLMMGLSGGAYLEKENGLLKRIMSTSITRVQYFNYSLISSYVCAFILSLMYIMSYKILGLSFNASIGLLLLIIIIQTLLVTCISGFISVFLNKNAGNTIMSIIMFVQIFIGGAFVPMEKVTNNPLLLKLKDFSPDAILTSIYKNLLLYNNINSIEKNLIVMIILSVFFYFASILKVKLKGVQ